MISVPMNYIEIEERQGHSITRLAGSRWRVADIVQIHLHGQSSIEWMVENYESLDYAKIHAALAYYYDHQTEIDQEIQEMLESDRELEKIALTIEKLKAKHN